MLSIMQLLFGLLAQPPIHTMPTFPQAPEDGSLLDTNMSAPFEKFSSAASQTDLSGELVPVGARLAEMARLRMQYDESRRHVQVHN